MYNTICPECNHDNGDNPTFEDYNFHINNFILRCNSCGVLFPEMPEGLSTDQRILLMRCFKDAMRTEKHMGEIRERQYALLAKQERRGVFLYRITIVLCAYLIIWSILRIFF